MKLGYGGRISLAADILDQARRLAAEDYALSAAEGFSGDEVRDILIPGWVGNALALLSLTGAPLRSSGRGAVMYATCGIDSHVDDMDGLSVCLVLHSDGFTFVQGRHRLKLMAGDWFVFDDRRPHAVNDLAGSTALLVLTHPMDDQ